MSERFLPDVVRHARQRRTLEDVGLNGAAELRTGDAPQVTQAQMAERRGVNLSVVERDESGEQPLRETTVHETAAALGTSTLALLLEELVERLPARRPALLAALDRARAEPTASNVFGAMLGNVLRSRGLSQSVTATMIGVDQALVSRWVTGSSALRESTIEALAMALGAPVLELWAEGLLYEAPVEQDGVDIAAVRAAFVKSTGASGWLVASRIATALGVNRSSLSRFAKGAPLSSELVEKIEAHMKANPRPEAALAAGNFPEMADRR